MQLFLFPIGQTVTPKPLFMKDNSSEWTASVLSFRDQHGIFGVKNVKLGEHTFVLN